MSFFFDNFSSSDTYIQHYPVLRAQTKSRKASQLNLWPVCFTDSSQQRRETTWDNLCVFVCVIEASPFIVDLLLDLRLDLGPDLLQVHRRLGRLAFLLRHTLSTALFQMGKRSETLMAPHHNTWSPNRASAASLSRTWQRRGDKKKK